MDNSLGSCDKVEKGSKTLTSFKQAISFKEVGFNVYTYDYL